MAKDSFKDFIDIKALWDEYRSKWYLFLMSVICCCLLGGAYIILRKPKYGVRANIIITQRDNGDFDRLSSIFGSNGSAEDEVFIVTSHTVLRDVARDLQLYNSHIVRPNLLPGRFRYKGYPVEIFPAEGIVDTLRTPLVFKIKIHDNGTADVVVKARRHTLADVEDAKFPITFDIPYGKFVLNTTPDYEKGEAIKTSIIVKGVDAVAEDLAKDITSSIAEKKSNVIRLGLNTIDAGYGVAVLNEIMKKYNERRIEDQKLQNTKTAEFLDERIALISADLNNAETDIQSYKTDQGIVDVSSEASYNMNRRSALESRVATAETNLEILNLNREFINDPENAYNMLPAPGNGEGAVSAAMETYNRLILNRMNLLNNAKGDNITLRQLTAQIDAMRENIKKSLDKAYDNAYLSLRDLRSQLHQTQANLGKIPSQERAFINMKRQQEIKQQLYLFLLQRREETAMLIANAQPKSSIVDEAYVLTEPLGLSNSMILRLAFLLGLLLPPLWFYIKRLTRNKFASREEFEEITDMPVVGEICQTDTTDGTVVVGNQNYSSAAELFRLLRSNMQFMLKGDGSKVVLVTSTISGEGKSFIAINLAASFALLGKKVLLMGMDIRNPKLREYLNLPPSRGITEYLASGSTDISSIIIHDQSVPNLDIITAGPVPPNPNELLSSSEVDDLFAQLRQMYDYIIVDSAPVGMVGDTFSLSRVADTTLYVCRVNYTTINDVRFFDEVYEEKRLPSMSVVINGTKSRKGYGYGYRSDKGKKK